LEGKRGDTFSERYDGDAFRSRASERTEIKGHTTRVKGIKHALMGLTKEEESRKSLTSCAPCRREKGGGVMLTLPGEKKKEYAERVRLRGGRRERQKRSGAFLEEGRGKKKTDVPWRTKKKGRVKVVPIHKVNPDWAKS